MHISEKGLALIKEFEGLELKAYVCPAGVLTIGYGHTGPDVIPEMEITQANADDLLKGDLLIFEKEVSKLLEGLNVSQGQFDACVCLAYNIGLGNFKNSTLLRFIAKGEHASAAKEFERWNKARDAAGNLRPLEGLTRRRKAERQLFEG